MGRRKKQVKGNTQKGEIRLEIEAKK